MIIGDIYAFPPYPFSVQTKLFNKIAKKDQVAMFGDEIESREKVNEIETVSVDAVLCPTRTLFIVYSVD